MHKAPVYLGIVAGWVWIAAACAAAAGVLGSVGEAQIHVETDPDGAVVVLDGVEREAAPLTLTGVAPGRHLLSARKDGYREARRSVSVVRGQKMSVPLKLEPVRGLVLVHSNPPADVELDGAFMGRTPLFSVGMPLGEHRLKFAAEGYQPRELAVTISDRTPRKVQVDLVSDSGTVRFSSEPAGAEVLLNGARRGLTPCTVDRVPKGGNRVQLTREGFFPHEEKLDVLAGGAYDVSAKLTPMPGTLEIVSIPAGARIYVDDQFRGETPLTLADLKPGKYRVRAEREGHAPDARDVVVERAGRKVEEFRLTRNSGMLLVVTEPADVKVFVDGRFRGASQAGKAGLLSEPFEVSLLENGQHVLQLSKKGYTHKPRTFVVQGTEIVNLHEKLARMFIPDTLVRTGPAAHDARTGVLVNKHPNGDVELEVRPGIIEKIEAARIVSIEPIKAPKE